MTGLSMLETNTASELSGAAFAVRHRGRVHVVVAAVATLQIEPGRRAALRPPRAVPQVDLVVPGRAGERLSRPGELCPPLPKAELLIDGSAFAPRGSAIPAASVRVHVTSSSGTLDKTLHVYGDRFAMGSPPSTFDWMPVVYERAVGGPGTDNPVGRSVGDVGGAPNIIDPRAAWGIAGFGPIAAHWPGRSRLAAAAGEPRVVEGLLELPDGLGLEWFQTAPEDQRLDTLDPDAWITIDGMHPEHPRLQTRLPGFEPSARWLEDPGVVLGERKLRLDRVVIEPDRAVATLCWRAAIEIHPERWRRVRAVIALAELPAMEPSLAQSPMGVLALEDRPDVDPLSGTVDLPSATALLGGLPFQSAAFRPEPRRSRATRPDLGLPFRSNEDVVEDDPIGATVALGMPSPLKQPPSVPPLRPFDAEATLPLPSSRVDEPAEEARDTSSEETRDTDPPPPLALDDDGARLGGNLARPLVRRTDDETTDEGLEVVANDADDSPEADEIPEVHDTPVSIDAHEIEGAFVRSDEPRNESLEAHEPLRTRPSEGTVSTLREEVVRRARDQAPLHDLALDGLDLSGLDLSGANLKDMSLVGCTFVETRLDGAALAGARLVSAQLANASLRGADLSRADLSRASLEGADLSAATLREARFTMAHAERARLDDVDAERASFEGARLDASSAIAARFAGADLRGAQLEGATWTRADLSGAQLGDAVLDRADLSGAMLVGAHGPGASLREANLTEVSATAVNLERAALDGANCARARFASSKLARISATKTSFRDADLRACDLGSAIAEDADFRGADLTEADLRQARFGGALLAGATMDRMNAQKLLAPGASFEGGRLVGAALRGARLRGANLRGTLLEATDLRDADLVEADLRGSDRKSAKLTGASMRGAQLDPDPSEG